MSGAVPGLKLIGFNSGQTRVRTIESYFIPLLVGTALGLCLGLCLGRSLSASTRVRLGCELGRFAIVLVRLHTHAHVVDLPDRAPVLGRAPLVCVGSVVSCSFIIYRLQTHVQ